MPFRGLPQHRWGAPSASRKAGWTSAAIFAVIPIICVASINPGDRLNVHVYNHPDLSTSATVDSRGNVEVPLAGTVFVKGLTSKQVAVEIRRRVSPFIPYPDVDVQDTTETQTLFVAGAPGGVLPYSPGETLAAAVAEVAKISPQYQTANAPPNAALDRFDRSRLDLKRVAVYRDDKALGTFDMIALRSTGNPGPTLYANDTVSLSNKPVAVSVQGSVNSPGKAYLWPDEQMSDAIDQAGGLTSSAATGRLTLVRQGEATRMIALGDPALTLPAAENDVITVPTAPRVTVAGLVEKPGIVSLQNDFSLLSALYTAGGINKFADIRNVQILRDGVRTRYDVVALTHGDLTQNPQLKDGDTVVVPEGHKIDWSQAFQALGVFNPVLYHI